MKIVKIIKLSVLMVSSVYFLGCNDNKSSSSSLEATQVDKSVKNIEIIPSSLKGVTPFKVEFYINKHNHKISSYYFSFDGKESIQDKINKDRITYTFKNSGKHKVKIAVKKEGGEIIHKDFIVQSRDMNFDEYKEQQNKEFQEFKANS